MVSPSPRLVPHLRSLLACASGALLVLGFAPFGWYWFVLIGLLGFLAALNGASPRLGFFRGWLFGVGLMGFGVFWIRISLNEFGNMDTWVAHLLTGVFVATMALFFGLVGWLVRRLDRGSARAVPVLLFPGLYLLVEWLRGWLFTGFPWLSLGYSQIDGPLGGFAPILGVYGVGLLILLSAGLLWVLLPWSGRGSGPGRVAAAAALVLIWGGGMLLKEVSWGAPSGPSFRAAVVQASIPQAMKWDPDLLVSTMEIYWDLTERNLDADLVVWPETAIPDFLHHVREVLIEPMAARAREEGTEIVLGIPVMESDTGRHFNALLSVGSREDLYAKRHLVPFGEFMPFKAWLGPLVDLFEVPMSDFSRGSAERPLLAVGDRVAGVSICYEDAFPTEVSQALPEAEFLINVSNDAWFGDSLAPHQHLEMARMRALENARYLLRATNTGISAIIDQRGRVLGTVPAFVRGDFAARVRPYAGATPYVRFGNVPTIGLATVMVLLGAGFIRRVSAGAREA
ncbi:apolipoprotein N-acyltransferase [Thiocapsa marina]|uniref:Apolipoprotein N-acyltransferase n=1 Tax=Thiocapsa marina 5811 TaxID=768671 RepID=F9UBM1_9GAMM|nr:apolipoprotein N-acyltransferase [Thiocapsa marina]EGV18339.1 Apolipoprotein N-acyltransferase [Thiocapsa marina 5811]